MSQARADMMAETAVTRPFTAEAVRAASIAYAHQVLGEPGRDHPDQPSDRRLLARIILQRDEPTFSDIDASVIALATGPVDPLRDRPSSAIGWVAESWRGCAESLQFRRADERRAKDASTKKVGKL